MRSEHRTLAARWFERLLDMLPVDAREIFPTDSLLDHVPALIVEISAYLQEPATDAIAANTAILEKARELGALRHAQRASLHQVLREYQILGGVLVTFVREEIERMSAPPRAVESVLLVSRLHQAVNVLSQATVETFVELYNETIAAQTSRLEQFTRMATHEWRQPLGALRFGVDLLRRADLDADLARRTWEAVDRNVRHLIDLTHKLEAVARMHGGVDNAVVQEVEIASVVEEAMRQVREMADARGVEIRMSDGLPTATVDVGRLELALINLLSNGIKYSDPAKAVRYVEVTGGRSDGSVRIAVLDNGIGIPEEARHAIFRRFTRAHVDRDDLRVDGVGLGLSIVDDCVRAMNGAIEVQSVERQGTTFVLTIPAMPVLDAARSVDQRR
ncbi:MAG TPA: HAMP domain-containing sensor histidine kinase [Vicinamibacterales bacterium]|jgi:signal transduction histidine kinase